MNITDLQWPNPGDPTQIAVWANQGTRGLIVARSGRKVCDWDMVNTQIAETFLVYIATQFVPGKLKKESRFLEASTVSLYSMTGPGTMGELASVPFFSPPLSPEELGNQLLSPVQEVVAEMTAEAKRLLHDLRIG